MESGIGALRRMGITDEASLDEIRRQQPVAAAEKQIALDRIELMKADKAFVRRLLDGDRQAKSEWTRMHQIISLPTARTPTTYPVK